MKNYKLSLITARNFLTYCIERRTYAFLGRTHEWAALDVAPTGIQESSYNLVNDFNDTVFAKEILDGNFSLVVRRVNWEEKVFVEWLDTDPLIADKDFYCLSSTNHVYKCISNNNGTISTVEPTLITTARFETADGYIWKYLCSVNNDDGLNFLTPDWMPVKEIYSSLTGYENQYASQVAAVSGTVDRLELIQSGSKYSAGTTISIIGDGINAAATLTVHPVTGAISSVEITNVGSGYTWANVVINDPQAIPGTGSFVQAVLSPLYGHGFNPAEELFCSDILSRLSIEADEGGLIKGDITFRKFLIVADPKLLNNSFATDYRYDNTSSVTLTGTSGIFVQGEKVTFTGGWGYIAYIDLDTLYLTSLDGIPSGIITGETSSASATVNVVTAEKFKISGSVIFKSYFDPRTKLIADNVESRPLFRF